MKIGAEIVSINLLYQYPLTKDQLCDWSKTINKIKPALYIEDLRMAMDKLIVGDCDFNPNIGIQNIFLALKSLERPMVY